MKKKPQTGNLKIEDALRAAGFDRVHALGSRILRASISPEASSLKPEAFFKAHAAFLQTAGKDPALLGCFRMDQLNGPVLIVHRQDVEDVEDVKIGEVVEVVEAVEDVPPATCHPTLATSEPSEEA